MTEDRRGSRRVHEGLIGARALVGTRYLADPALREEYGREIAPRTEVALGRVLAEVYGVGAPPRRAIDLGAGTGAAGRALRARFGSGLEVVGVDVVDVPGVRRADLARELPLVDGRFDLVVAAHLLNELYVRLDREDRVRRRVERVLAWSEALLAPEGVIVLIEPALRETSRELLEVRDGLVEAGLTVLAPCLRQGRCPALARERDWCHDAAPTAGRERVDFSYLVLSKGRRRAEEDDSDEKLLRVVSDPLREKGRLRFWACGASGRHEIVRLNRDASASNAGLDHVSRGDVIRVGDGLPHGDGVRIGAGSTISRR